MSPWNIAEGILIAWIIIKLIGPAAEAELEGYRKWTSKNRYVVIGLVIVYVVIWNAYRLLK